MSLLVYSVIIGDLDFCLYVFSCQTFSSSYMCATIGKSYFTSVNIHILYPLCIVRFYRERETGHIVMLTLRSYETTTHHLSNYSGYHMCCFFLEDSKIVLWLHM